MATGLPLKLAGKIHDVEERDHFDAAVRPHLDGKIEYLGEVSHDEKVHLLQRAMVTLFPIQWPEPFGLVMVESMACGTPVAAIGLGAVPEVVEDGRSGIVVDTIEEMAACMPRMLELDPMQARAVGGGELLGAANGARLRARLRAPRRRGVTRQQRFSHGNVRGTDPVVSAGSGGGR